MKNEQIVGAALAEVLPVTEKWWFQRSELLRLNLILLVPLLSSSVAGYDGSLMNGLQSLPQVRCELRLPSTQRSQLTSFIVAVILRTPDRISPRPRQCCPVDRVRYSSASSRVA